jgi:MFS transporter, DHA2 family, methylenomycin A resistance protein
LLVVGGVLACFIHPHSHRREPVRSAAAAVAQSGRGE